MRAEFIDLPAAPLHAPFEVKGLPYRPRRTVGDRLLEALMALAEAQASLLSHNQKPWASITFTGSRHEVMLDFEGSEAVAAGERFIAALPDHEFSIPGQLVADATVSEVNHSTLPYPRMVVTSALLLLEDA
uniref:hypothetical protein n=1 Tax=uncultured Altererythrobacter sp. TaxID=500840 RepID=UPI00260985B4|nr:hypothetical protein [uncultured Altererythrobacter sp.]